MDPRILTGARFGHADAVGSPDAPVASRASGRSGLVGSRDGAPTADPPRSPHGGAVRSRRSAVVVVAESAFDGRPPSVVLVRSARSPRSRRDRDRLGQPAAARPDLHARCISALGRPCHRARARTRHHVRLRIRRPRGRPSDDVVREVLVGHGFAIEEVGLVETWLAAAARPAISSLPEGYRSSSRLETMTRPHHMNSSERNLPDPEPRLRQTSLYRPDLDLVVHDRLDSVAAYGLFWYDPETATGLVEPMRTEDEHQRRGLARHILTTGLDLLAGAGAQTSQDLLRTRQPGIGAPLPQRRLRTRQADRRLVTPGAGSGSGGCVRRRGGARSSGPAPSSAGNTGHLDFPGTYDLTSCDVLAPGPLGRVGRRRRIAAGGGRDRDGPDRAARGRGAAGAPGGRGVGHPHHGDHLHRLLRGVEHRPGLAVRPDPTHHRGAGVGGGGAGAGAAAAGAQPVHRRRLQRPLRRRRRRLPGRPARRLGELPHGVRGGAPEVRRVGPHLRVGSRARRRRHDVRARGQPARPVRRQLRDREPGRRQEGVPRGLRQPEHRPRRRLHRRAEQAPRLAWRRTV